MSKELPIVVSLCVPQPLVSCLKRCLYPIFPHRTLTKNLDGMKNSRAGSSSRSQMWEDHGRKVETVEVRATGDRLSEFY